MEVKCITHPYNDAIILCEKCGFLCGEHTNKIEHQNHNLLMINPNLRKLYKVYTSKKAILAKSFTLTKIKTIAMKFFEGESIRHLKALQEINNLMVQYKSQMTENDANTAFRYFENTFNINCEEISTYKHALFNKLNEKTNYIGNLANEVMGKFYKLYNKNESFGNNNSIEIILSKDNSNQFLLLSSQNIKDNEAYAVANMIAYKSFNKTEISAFIKIVLHDNKIEENGIKAIATALQFNNTISTICLLLTRDGKQQYRK